MLNERVSILEEGATLEGFLTVPKNVSGVVVFASGSGEARNDENNQVLAESLYEEGIATLLLDLVTPEEARSKETRFNIKLLELRLEGALDWVSKRRFLSGKPLGIFGSDTGSAACFVAAAKSKHEISAIVSKGGRVDMAEKHLPYVEAPCLLLAAEEDELTLKANSKMMERISYARLHIIKDSDHAFSTEIVSEEVCATATRWFRRYFKRKTYLSANEEYKLDKMTLPFYDRKEAGLYLANRLLKYEDQNPLVLAIPRGAVEIADIISTELDCDMDVILVGEISLQGPGGESLGSINEYGDLYLSGKATSAELEEMISQSAKEVKGRLKAYREKFGALKEPKDYEGRTVIIVDDGIASGSNMLSAIITVKEKGADKVIVASPVVSEGARKMLELASDETEFLNVPENFYAVSQFYKNFPQVGDGEVEKFLR